MRTGGQKSSRRAASARIAVAVLAIAALAAVWTAPSAGAASRATKVRTARVIATAQDAQLGTILVAGRTVYTLKPSKTACTTACLKVWPAVLLPHGAKTASAGMGVDASKLGTTAAAHGTRQVTYSGKRLYWYVEDTAPGQVRGNFTDKWGKWATVTVAANAASSTAPATEAPTTAPATQAPATPAPATEPPATEAPATSPPQTAPPATSPPETKPPATTSPGTGGVAF
jgi:predicted lipoprotein with Yx(FWY)xxD motif